MEYPSAKNAAMLNFFAADIVNPTNTFAYPRVIMKFGVVTYFSTWAKIWISLSMYSPINGHSCSSSSWNSRGVKPRVPFSICDQGYTKSYNGVDRNLFAFVGIWNRKIKPWPRSTICEWEYTKWLSSHQSFCRILKHSDADSPCWNAKIR